jgi:hypothetical protein
MQPVLPLNEMSTADKLSMMELLWDDLCRSREDLPTPAWHEEVLLARQREIEEGQAQFLSLDEFRQSIEKELR